MKKNVLKSFSITILAVVLMAGISTTAFAYWGDSVKVSYTKGTNWGDKMGVSNLTKVSDSKTAYFDCGYRTSWTKPQVCLVNTASSPSERSNYAVLDNGIVSASSTAAKNYYYNVKIVGSNAQWGTDTMTFRFNPD